MLVSGTKSDGDWNDRGIPGHRASGSFLVRLKHFGGDNPWSPSRGLREKVPNSALDNGITAGSELRLLRAQLFTQQGEDIVS